MLQDENLVQTDRVACKKNNNPTDEQIARAWAYYQQADNLQHQRHNIFILTQTILTGSYIGFAQAPTDAKVLVALIGALYALMWFLLTERLSGGMNKLSRDYLEHDQVYRAYLGSLGKGFTGRTILNRIIPLTTFFAWIIILALRLYAKTVR